MLLKIKEGYCINTDNIECLEFKDQMTTLVHMKSGMTYESFFPYYTIIDILEGREKEKQEVNDGNKGLLENLNAAAKTATFFAG